MQILLHLVVTEIKGLKFATETSFKTILISKFNLQLVLEITWELFRSLNFLGRLNPNRKVCDVPSYANTKPNVACISAKIILIIFFFWVSLDFILDINIKKTKVILT